MPERILPDTFLALLAAFQPCFHAPSAQNFRLLIAGWVHCLGRHTATAVTLAAGAVGQQHISVSHRFFSRAQWSLDQLGHVLFRLALRWLPADQPLSLLGDDTLARKQGKCVALCSMHHDPLLSTGRKPFFSFGHVWVVLALWVPLPMNPDRGFALPILCRLYVGSKRGGRADAPSRPGSGRRRQAADDAFRDAPRATKPELLREMVVQVAAWAPERKIRVLCDSAYACRTVLEQRPTNVHVVSRLRMDAALWTSPPARTAGQQGRPRRKGRRLPTPKTVAAQCRTWQTVPLLIYGRRVDTQLFSYTALWYGALRDQPLRIVVVRDPTGKRRDEAFFSTDVTVAPADILEGYAHRWTLEVTFHDAKQFLGFADPQSQTEQAVRRTAPLAFLVYDLVLLWSAAQTQRAGPPVWLWRPWYPDQHAPSFLDMLTALRLAGWRTWISQPPSSPRRPQKPVSPWPDAVLATA
jgi:SRSO17 transposase